MESSPFWSMLFKLYLIFLLNIFRSSTIINTLLTRPSSNWCFTVVVHQKFGSNFGTSTWRMRVNMYSVAFCVQCVTHKMQPENYAHFFSVSWYEFHAVNSMQMTAQEMTRFLHNFNHFWQSPKLAVSILLFLRRVMMKSHRIVCTFVIWPYHTTRYMCSKQHFCE